MALTEIAVRNAKPNQRIIDFIHVKWCIDVLAEVDPFNSFYVLFLFFYTNCY